MKSFKNIYHTVCLTGLLAVSMSSCTDWLTIYPQDRVVEENFWEDKNDLEGVRYGAYRQMAQTVSKLVLWGDLRSDSYTENSAMRDGNQTATHNRYIEIINGMPDSSMSEFEWGGIYTTINYCNKVLQHGEEVLERLQNFQRGAHLVINAVHQFLVAFANDGAVHTAHVFGTQGLDFAGQHVFKSGGGFRNELVIVFHLGKFSAKIGNYLRRAKIK